MTLGAWRSIEELEDNLTAEEMVSIYIAEKKKQLFIVTKGQSELDDSEIESNEDKFDRVKRQAGIKKAERDADRRMELGQYDPGLGDAVEIKIDGI